MFVIKKRRAHFSYALSSLNCRESQVIPICSLSKTELMAFFDLASDNLSAAWITIPNLFSIHQVKSVALRTCVLTSFIFFTVTFSCLAFCESFVMIAAILMPWRCLKFHIEIEFVNHRVHFLNTYFLQMGLTCDPR